tara:strand:- start:323 stop:775 length:453 start_codon:yes stop_codon:yes gene_type:complete
MTFPIRKASAQTTVKPAKSAGSGKSSASEAEDLLALHLRAEGIEAIREYRFGAEACGGPGKGLRDRLAKAGLQDWRADFALPEQGLLIEVEGGGWVKGRHNTGSGFAADLKKYDAAARLGWRVYRCDPAMIKSGRAIETILILMQQGRAA